MTHSDETPGREFLPRQCVRQEAEIPFRLGGRDACGQFFEEAVVTRDISECGGSFTSNRSLSVGSTLKLADSSGFLSLIRIDWNRELQQASSYGFSFVRPLEE